VVISTVHHIRSKVLSAVTHFCVLLKCCLLGVFHVCWLKLATLVWPIFAETVICTCYIRSKGKLWRHTEIIFDHILMSWSRSWCCSMFPKSQFTVVSFLQSHRLWRMSSDIAFFQNKVTVNDGVANKHVHNHEYFMSTLHLALFTTSGLETSWHLSLGGLVTTVHLKIYGTSCDDMLREDSCSVYVVAFLQGVWLDRSI
jgi:hypothetical protein